MILERNDPLTRGQAMALEQLSHQYICGYKEFFVSWDKLVSAIPHCAGASSIVRVFAGWLSVLLCPNSHAHAAAGGDHVRLHRDGLLRDGCVFVIVRAWVYLHVWH